MKRKKRRNAVGGLLTAVVCLTAGLLATFAIAPAHGQSGDPGVDPDYAALVWGDPWDYSNPEDQIIADDGPVRGLTNMAISGGQLHFDSSGPSYFHPLWGGYPGSIPHGREGELSPVDTSRFGRLVVRMYASAAVPAGVRWYTCQAISDACQGGFNFFTVPGWHTYDLPLVAMDETNLRVPWAGRVVSLRLAFNPPAPTHFDVDWMRLVPNGAVEVTEQFGPIPVIDEPDRSGGADYAEVDRGDRWDFDQPTDVHHTNNLAGGVHDGVFEGTNAGPAMNDPSIALRLGRAFAGDEFHRLTMRFRYDGGFNLEDKVGGGSMARIIWRIAHTPLTRNGRDLQNSDDIVTYPNEPVITVDLATNPPAAITDPEQGAPRIGWAGQLIEMLRIDPNEDRGARRWVIEDVKLADDDATDHSRSFTIVWHDNAFAPETTASLFYDTDGKGFDGTLIAGGLPLIAGANQYLWTPPPSLHGPVHIYAVHVRGNTVGRSYATGPLRIAPPGPPRPYRFGLVVGGPSSQAGKGTPPAPSGNSLSTSNAPGVLALKASSKTVKSSKTSVPPKTAQKNRPKKP